MKWRHCIVLLIVAMLFLTSSVSASAEAILELPANLEVIEEEAFYGATSIGQVVLSARTREIQAKAFANSSLTEIDIPNPSIEIAENAFDNHSANLVIRGYSGSTAESYASAHNIRFALLETSVVLTQSWEDFAGASSSLVQNYQDSVTISGADSAYANGRLIVKAEGELPDLSQFGPDAIVRDPENHYLIQFSDSQIAEDCASYLSSAAGILYVEPDQNLNGSDMYIDDFETQSYSWGVSATNADAYAADLRKRGKTTQVIVAVVDTGVESSHPMLSARLVNGYDFIDNDTTPEDGHNHGTHVSGTIVDCTPGLNVYIMPVRVLGNSGSGSSSGVAQGIRYAARNNANVINMSLGGGHSSYIDEAVDYALQQGVTVVVAAGNEQDNVANHCPAHISNCITVSAVNQSKERAYFSNYGNAVDIAAPGVNITSAVRGGGYASFNGTSMATPHVSAAAAMLLCDTPGLSPSNVESMLRNASEDLGESGWDAYYGAGFLKLDSFIKSKPQQYTVTYNANNGTNAPASQIKIQGVDLVLSKDVPDRADSTGTYKITFNTNGGNVNPSYKEAAYTRSYDFLGWTTNTRNYQPGDVYSEDADLTLYAMWHSNEKAATVFLPTPTRLGYNFKGWAIGNTTYASNTLWAGYAYTPDRNVVLSAIWEEDQFVGSGTWGNLNWAIDNYGTLTISGSGAMDYFSSPVDKIAWRSHKNSINSVVINNGVTSIGANAFEGCDNLSSVSIPNSVESIGASAFAYCDSLGSVVIPSGVVEIEPSAFNCCNNLTGIYVNASNRSYSDLNGILFNKTNTEIIQCPGAYSGSYTIPSSVRTIGTAAFKGCYGLTDVTIPASVKNIGSFAFESCESLTRVSIPMGVTSIEEFAFRDCYNLVSISIPSTVTSIGRFAFQHCSIPNVTIPNGITAIEEYTFYGCKYLEWIKIPSSVTSFNDYAFYSCNALDDIYYGGTQSQWNAISKGSNNEPLLNATIHYNAS